MPQRSGGGTGKEGRKREAVGKSSTRKTFRRSLDAQATRERLQDRADRNFVRSQRPLQRPSFSSAPPWEWQKTRWCAFASPGRGRPRRPRRCRAPATSLRGVSKSRGGRHREASGRRRKGGPAASGVRRLDADAAGSPSLSRAGGGRGGLPSKRRAAMPRYRSTKIQTPRRRAPWSSSSWIISSARGSTRAASSSRGGVAGRSAASSTAVSALARRRGAMFAFEEALQSRMRGAARAPRVARAATPSRVSCPPGIWARARARPNGRGARGRGREGACARSVANGRGDPGRRRFWCACVCAPG